ncbi:MAG: hypothetical protein WCD18_26610 [Thermosynechococcaceae cyanobacterium]
MSSTLGSWELLPFLAPLVPVHAALLPPVSGGNAKVLFLAGSQAGIEGGQSCPDCTAVWDYKNGESFYRPLTPILASTSLPYNFFCAGHTFLPNGNLLVAGGTLQISPFLGLPDSIIFNTATLSWETQPSMAHGRWYPTLTLLGDGRVIAFSGRDENGQGSRIPEIYTSGTGWIAFTNQTNSLSLYPSIFLLDNGQLFSAGRSNGQPRRIILPTDFETPIQMPLISGLTENKSASYSPAVLLPPAQDQKIMILGGYQSKTATARVNIIDFKDSDPTYKVAPSLLYSRGHHQAVILPDRTVFVCGGSMIRQSISKAVYQSEIYDPNTNSWTEVASNSVPRLYHSVALLLPNGKVLLAGSTPPKKPTELRLEIYSPPYLFQGTRPSIDSAPVEISRGQTILVATQQASTIQ